MAPIALPSPPVQPSPPATATSIPRRPSPWHQISHPKSQTQFPSQAQVQAQAQCPCQAQAPWPQTQGLTPSQDRRHSSTSLTLIPSPSPPHHSTPPSPSPDQLSSSALREWHHRLSHSSVQRHQLASDTPTPKLAAERDREGNMEYKLKLIEPSPERFEKLVTQMLWRLREGGGEAIYEIGLADDGTVIGLTRAEMDGSLRTLELMASEVGGTVLVLKEIVLVAPERSRPDLDPTGAPRRSSTSTSLAGVPDLTGKRYKAKQRWSENPDGQGKGGHGKERQVVFDQADMNWDFSSGEESDGSAKANCLLTGQDDEDERESWTKDVEVDEDVPTFHLDLEDALPPSPTTSNGSDEKMPWKKERRKPGKPQSVPPAPATTAAQQEDITRKAEAKQLKSFQRRENRRLDLLRGDGRSPLPFAPLTPPIALPHQPARPSSLRLATPPSDTVSHDIGDTRGGENGDDDESDLVHILSVPLDNLSLSFADVRTVSSSGPRPPLNPVRSDSAPGSASPSVSISGSETETEHTSDMDGALIETGRGWIVPRQGEEERICVEALVVRKAQEDVWEFGGSEDGWGFGSPGVDEVDGEGDVEWMGGDDGDRGDDGGDASDREGAEDAWGFWGDDQ